MFEFTLLKSLFFELDRHKMKGASQIKKKNSTYRRIEIHYDKAPGITSLTAEERILPYLDRYYLYVNDEKISADLGNLEVKQAIYEFYREHFPTYLKEDLPEDLTHVNLLDCFEVFHMPDYRPKHAFPGLITLEDLRNGNIHDEDKPRFSFPGLELLGGSGRKPGVPAAAEFEGYTAFDGDRDSARNKIDEMKKKYAGQLESMNVNGMLDDILKEEPENV
ncbi:MAG: hypothetical protein Q4D60_01230 [Eubacteriales bacterium]|nr:hypothetical protein [Eubacteriales bacterium]